MTLKLSEQVAAAPPITVAGMSLFGIPLDSWVQLLALFWLLVQILYFFYDKWRDK